MWKTLFRTVQITFLTALLLVFAIVLCLTHPIFVFTTLLSLSVTATRLSVTLLKHWLGGQHNRTDAAARNSSHPPASEHQSFSDGSVGPGTALTPRPGEPASPEDETPFSAFLRRVNRLQAYCRRQGM